MEILLVVVVVLLAYIAWKLGEGKRRDKRDTKRLHQGMEEAADILRQREQNAGRPKL